MRRLNWPLAAALAWMFASLPGCMLGLSQHAQKLCADGLSSYEQGDYAATVRYMDEFLRDNPRSRETGRGYYLRGQAKFQLQDYQGAKADFEQALKRVKDKTTRANSLAALGDIAWNSDDMTAAENMYRQALIYCSRDARPADHACYRLGCVLQRQGRWRDADAQFNRVVYFFAGSQLAGRAGRRLHARRWTIQAGAFRIRKLADEFAGRLRKQNLPAVARPVASPDRPVFAVQVGRYQTYDQASAALQSVRRLADDAFVTVTR